MHKMELKKKTHNKLQSDLHNSSVNEQASQLQHGSCLWSGSLLL